MLDNIKSRLIQRIALGLSVVLLANFSFSLFIWFQYVWHVSTTDDRFNWPYLFHAVPALILSLTSLVALILIHLKKHKAVFLVLLSIILSVGCFIYETQYDGLGYPIFVNGPESYQGAGYRYIFVNWWWYEKDVIRSGDFTTEKVFHHFFGIRPKGYISSSIIMYIEDANKVKDAVKSSEHN
jgi:hypothetical protein